MNLTDIKTKWQITTSEKGRISNLYYRRKYVIKADGTFEEAGKILVCGVVDSMHGTGGSADCDRYAALWHACWYGCLACCS